MNDPVCKIELKPEWMFRERGRPASVFRKVRGIEKILLPTNTGLALYHGQILLYGNRTLVSSWDKITWQPVVIEKGKELLPYRPFLKRLSRHELVALEHSGFGW